MDGALTSGVIILSLITQVLSSGIFEMVVTSVFNPNGRRLDGTCCNVMSDERCQDECRTFITSCLLQYTSAVSDDPDCIYGNKTSRVIGGNDIRKNFTDNSSSLSMSFKFSWPALFTLVVDARHDADQSITLNDSSPIIIRSIVSRTLHPPSFWYTETTTSNDKVLQYSYRVICDDFYFGSGCEIFCRPRNDSFGHYVCDQDGTKLCLPGWEGEFCQTAKCWDKCNMSHGICYEPFQCSCLIGWEGESCDQCIRKPGCRHGYCHNPWQCICHGDWTGRNCDIEINFCTKYEPCEHGGTCLPDIKANYTCQCKPGYSGVMCEAVLCKEGYCKNGGSCSNTNADCECTDKYYGPHCEYRKLTCEETDCMNGGTCIATQTGTICECRKGYTGANCKSEIDECQSSPCKYGAKCKDGVNGFICDCAEGYMGRDCSIIKDPCVGITCFNNGTCASSENGLYGTCLCRPGTTGQRCEVKIDPCNGIECKNNGRCTTSDDGIRFQCICEHGYNGVYCEIKTDLCRYIECANGGTCKSYDTHYICVCDPHYTGKHCKILMMPADQTITSDPKITRIPIVKDNAVSLSQISSLTLCLSLVVSFIEFCNFL